MTRTRQVVEFYKSGMSFEEAVKKSGLSKRYVTFIYRVLRGYDEKEGKIDSKRKKDIGRVE